jgi:hypothetical protein
MDEENALPKRGGVTTLLFTALLVSPCFCAWASSYVISQGGAGSHSGMWFLYQVSQYLSYLGLVVAAVLTIVNGSLRTTARIFIFLMALLIVGGISALWYATHIYRSPWY